MSIPHEPAFDAAEYAGRLAAVRRGMAERDIDGLLLFSPHNVFYLSGMDSENLFDFQCLIVPAAGEPVLVILDFEEARAANSVGAGRTVSYHAFDDPIEAVLAQVDALGLGAARLGLESGAGITPASYAHFVERLAGASVADSFGIVENVRLVKSPAEQAYMRRAAALTDAATLAAYDVLRPGVRDADIARAAGAVLAPVLDGIVFHHNFGYPVGIGYPGTWIESLGFFLRVDNPRPLAAGMVFHLPMSLRKFGAWGINQSHTMLITESGAESLTKTRARLHVLDATPI